MLVLTRKGVEAQIPVPALLCGELKDPSHRVHDLREEEYQDQYFEALSRPSFVFQDAFRLT